MNQVSDLSTLSRDLERVRAEVQASIESEREVFGRTSPVADRTAFTVAAQRLASFAVRSGLHDAATTMLAIKRTGPFEGRTVMAQCGHGATFSSVNEIWAAFDALEIELIRLAERSGSMESATQADVKLLDIAIQEEVNRSNGPPEDADLPPRYDSKACSLAAQRLAVFAKSQGERGHASEFLRVRNAGVVFGGTEFGGLRDAELRARQSIQDALEWAELELLSDDPPPATPSESANGRDRSAPIEDGCSGGWATSAELDEARSVAKAGLLLLAQVSRYASCDWLTKCHSDPTKSVEQFERAEQIVERLLPGLERVVHYSGQRPELEPSPKFLRSLRTIERCWGGTPVSPFCPNSDVAGDMVFATAHEVSICWAASYIHWIIDGPHVGAGDRVVALPAWLQEASQHVELAEGMRQKLEMQIVSEWRSAMEWVETSTVHSRPTSVAQPAITREIPESQLVDSSAKPIMVTRAIPGTDGEFETLRFDPSQWVLAGSKTFGHDWCMFEHYYLRECEERLYSDRDGEVWVVIEFCVYVDVNVEEPPSYRGLSPREAAEWFIDCDSDPPAKLLPLLEGYTLTPKVLTTPTTENPHWDGAKLKVGSEVIATVAPKATNLRPVLEAFQLDEWPERIDDPLPFGCDDPGQRLRDTVRMLNRKQDTILFESDGTGEGITWKWRGSSGGDASEGSSTELP